MVIPGLLGVVSVSTGAGAVVLVSTGLVESDLVAPRALEVVESGGTSTIAGETAAGSDRATELPIAVMAGGSAGREVVDVDFETELSATVVPGATMAPGVAVVPGATAVGSGVVDKDGNVVEVPSLGCRLDVEATGWLAVDAVVEADWAKVQEGSPVVLVCVACPTGLLGLKKPVRTTKRITTSVKAAAAAKATSKTAPLAFSMRLFRATRRSGSRGA